MEAISQWLLHDDQEELFEILFAIALNIVFLGVVILLLWPMGELALALLLAKGYCVLWLIIFITVVLLHRIHGLFRVNLYDHGNAFVISNLALSCFLQMGWAAFAAQSVRSVTINAMTWHIVIVYVVTFLSCLIAFFAVSSFFKGHIYRLISLPLALICFVLFSVSPTSRHFMFGWFFDLF